MIRNTMSLLIFVAITELWWLDPITIVDALLPRKSHYLLTSYVTGIQQQQQQQSLYAISSFRIKQKTLLASVPGADIEQGTNEETIAQPQMVGNNIIYRGKVNEIDYCIAPADISLSRAYNKPSQDDTNNVHDENVAAAARSFSTLQTTSMLSLTQALNNASNRAVRRILLAKCWPSEEALNLSLRLAAAAEKQAEQARQEAGTTNTAKCPVPRPILNLLMRKGGPEHNNSVSSNATTKNSKDSLPAKGGSPPSSPFKTRSMEQYVKDQMQAFHYRYGSLAGYNYAEAYLESILSLATTGKESPRVQEVLESRVYDESYRRFISVLKSVGVVLEELDSSVAAANQRFQIAQKLRDENFCLSVMDMLDMKETVSSTAKTKDAKNKSLSITDANNGSEKKEQSDNDVQSQKAIAEETPTPETKTNPLRFWRKRIGKAMVIDVTKSEEANARKHSETTKKYAETDSRVILCSQEPSMTRQLNALSNIVHRGLLYGGDQELLVLSETLADNRQAFVQRWYPETGPAAEDMMDETRPGVQYLNALINLLRLAYDEGIVTNLDPLVTLNSSYANSYERLMASLVELGSGYVRPETDDIMNMPKPRTAQEELGRFAVWESTFRSTNGEGYSYPDDLEGVWEVKDEVGGETIGISTVTLAPLGEVIVDPPLQGLRWRLDPGPTHLDTCTFQVLSEDGTILQYRGFLDRGARLEARFSKRPARIRGSVMFQMRYGGSKNYWKDMLPVNYKTGATKFEMTKQGSNKS